jgi:hypothetical protein
MQIAGAEVYDVNGVICILAGLFYYFYLYVELLAGATLYLASLCFHSPVRHVMVPACACVG